jgi:hypothetical protein
MKVNTVLIVLLAGLSLVVAGAAGLYAWRMQPEQREVHAPGDAVRFDDFRFAVVGARREASLGEGAARAQARGVFVVVQLRVSNDAQRVEFTFRPETLRLVDARGALHELSPAGQAALAALGRDGCRRPLPPGASCIGELAFDVPADALGGGEPGALCLRFFFGGALPNLLDLLAYGNRVLALP